MQDLCFSVEKRGVIDQRNCIRLIESNQSLINGLISVNFDMLFINNHNTFSIRTHLRFKYLD